MHLVSCNGAQIPALGLGTFELNGEAGYRMVSAAIEMGYRHFDTAERYENEAEIGRAIEASGLRRDQFFVTTKIWPSHYRRGAFQQSLSRCLERLRLVPDLLLLHYPPADVPIAEAVENVARAAEEGHTHHIGVSNFTIDLVREAIRLSPRPLVANQVEYHPFLDQRPTLDECKARGMSLIAYSPLAQGRVFRSEVLARIGRSHGKSTGQVALRWLLQQDGVVAIPRSSSEQRARENLDVFDFALDELEIGRIASLAERSVGPSDPPIYAPEWIDS